MCHIRARESKLGLLLRYTDLTVSKISCNPIICSLRLASLCLLHYNRVRNDSFCQTAGAGSESLSDSANSAYSLRSDELLAVFQHTLCAHRGTFCARTPNTAAHFAIHHCIVPDCEREESFMIVYRELSSLERDLAIPGKTLYGISNNLNKHYHQTKLPKKCGGYRNLSVPDEVLKSIQRRITEVLLIHMPVSRYAKAYRFGSSPLLNAKQHVGKHVVLKLDILHFFDSIRYSTVKDKVFPGEIYADPLRILLTMLCYHKDALPQGAPSSPAITNIILYEFDELVGRWCLERGIVYTRYCDDMTFSGDIDPAEVISFIRAELKKEGFLLNEQKTKIQRPGQQQTVTGIVVNEGLSIPADYRRKLRQELYYCRRFGIREHLQRIGSEISEETYRMQMIGKVNYLLQVHPNNRDMLEARKWLSLQSTGSV